MAKLLRLRGRGFRLNVYLGSIRLAIPKGDSQADRQKDWKAINPENRFRLAIEFAEARKQQLGKLMPAVHFFVSE